MLIFLIYCIDYNIDQQLLHKTIDKNETFVYINLHFAIRTKILYKLVNQADENPHVRIKANSFIIIVILL